MADALTAALTEISQRLINKTPEEKARTLSALAVLSHARQSRIGPQAVSKDRQTKAAAARCLEEFHYFVETAWPLLEADNEFVDGWHIKELCDLLQEIGDAKTRKKQRRLLKKVNVINVPPGTMKSLLVSVFWPAWMWARNPRLRFLTASYSDSKTIEFNLAIRDIVQSSWYQEFFWGRELALKMGVRKVQIKGDQNEKVRFDTTCGGWRIASSVGGKATGLHPDFIIIDDPMTEAQSRSEEERKKVWTWYRRTISIRGAGRNATILVIMQRLHQEDLSGMILELGIAEHVMFPMYFDPARADPRDHRTTAGELLWPGLFDEQKCRDMELILGVYGVAGQFQQRPTPEGGGMFHEDWFPIVEIEDVPNGIEFRAWDTAATKDGGDWTVGSKVRLAMTGVLYIMHVKRGQWDPDRVDTEIKTTAHADGKKCKVREQKEPGSAGVAVIKARAKHIPGLDVPDLAGFDYEGVPTTGDKETRAKPYRTQAQSGNVRLVRGSWNREFIDEHTNFPNGKHDDQVDATSTAVNCAMTEKIIKGGLVW